jgi:hypothetical protein
VTRGGWWWRRRRRRRRRERHGKQGDVAAMVREGEERRARDAGEYEKLTCPRAEAVEPGCWG